jgi:hypothetical protein
MHRLLHLTKFGFIPAPTSTDGGAARALVGNTIVPAYLVDGGEVGLKVKMISKGNPGADKTWTP